jgi:hypothetical protein
MKSFADGAARDPRIEPQPGDVVMSRAWSPPRRRVVTDRIGDDVYYRLNGSGAPKWSWLWTWQEWCCVNKAEVQAND